MIFYGTSKELQFKPDNGRAWLDYLVQNEGKKLVININLDKARRSYDQNSYYWAFLEIIANDTGNNADDLHKLFKGLFLPKRAVVVKGKTYMMSGSTKDLNKPAFSEYLDKISAHVEIPLPDQKKLQDAGLSYPVENNKTAFDE